MAAARSLLRRALPTRYRRMVARDRVRRGLRRADRVAWLMDESIRIPIIGRRVGLDAVLGLIPGLGDFLGAVVAVYPILEALYLGAPLRLVGRMLSNVLLDFFVGMVPVVGDVADAVLQVNRRNVNLLRDHFARERPRSSRWLPIFGTRAALGG